MTKPLSSLRDRPLAQHALALAWMRVLVRQERRAVKESETVAEKQLRLELEAIGKSELEV
ncbi:MAG: hypothetical protein ABFD89_09115 [Bryobacteraceae bacterium]